MTDKKLNSTEIFGKYDTKKIKLLFNLVWYLRPDPYGLVCILQWVSLNTQLS